MEIIDLSQAIKNKRVSKGTILILQGQDQKAINIIHSGMAELLSNSKLQLALSPEDVISSSLRVGLIKGESIYGVLDIRSHLPYKRSVRALTDCIISVIPISNESIFNKLKGNIRLNLKILRSLVQRIDSGNFLLSSYKTLWHNLNNVAVSIALAGRVPAAEEKKKAEEERTSLQEYSVYLKDRIKEKQLPLPEEWDPNVFLGGRYTNLDKLDLPNKVDNARIERLTDYKQFLFFKRFLRLKDDLLISVVQKDEPMTFYIYQFLSDALTPVIDKNEELANIIYELIDNLFADKGWISQVMQEQDKKDNKAVIFNHYMGKFCWQFRKEIIQLMGIDLKQSYPVFSNLISYIKINPEQLQAEVSPASRKEADASSPSADSGIQVSESVVAKYKNLLNRILEFSFLGDEFCASFKANLNKFKGFENKFENEPKLNAIKKHITRQYWKLYEKCFMNVIESGLKNFIPGIMLHFGVLDETLLKKEDLAFIDQAFNKSLYVDSVVPVMTLPYFLEKIYKDEIKPSVSELGQSFHDVLKAQARASRKQSKDDLRDTVEDRVKFEIGNAISSAYKMLFGSVTTAFPILCSEAIMGQMSQVFMEPEILAEKINFYREIDFSMFYRDVVIHAKYGSEIVKKEVIPNFVLYPIFGTKMLMWQELDGAKRDTTGRAFLPLFFYGDLDKSILTLAGNFRWELQRIIAGASWMDPVEGGLAGAYYDYITFYKKNPNLTMSNKDRLKEFVKKTRSDKDRFTSDYLTWVINEFEGMPKLTNVAREIFYRYCPFKQKERERLGQRPAFGNLEMKYRNITKKSILRMESRIKKYEKGKVPVPQELIDYLTFLRL